jgi:hypothetical protein
MEVSGQLHASAALPPGKEPLYPLDRRLGGPQNRSGHGGEEKNSQPLPGLEHPFIQPVALCRTAELSQLHHMRGMILNDELGKMGKAWLFQGTVPAFM